MRTFRLAQVAAHAETLRLRRHAAIVVRQVVFGGVAFVFAVAMLIFAHAAGWNFVQPLVGPGWASLILAGADLLLAGLFLLLASRGGGNDRIANDARAVRQDALRQIGGQMTMIAMVNRIFWMMRRMGRARADRAEDQSRPR